MSTTWDGRSELKLDLVSQISQAPGIYVRANIKAVPTFTPRQNEKVIQKSGGGADIYRMGRDEIDISLRAPFIDRATKELLEEIRERGLQVYLYAVPFGSCQLYAPLNKSTDSDPSVGEFLHQVATPGIYMIDADPRFGFHLRSTTEEEPLLQRGIRTKQGTMSEFALGRGLYFPRNDIKNLILNSLMTNVTAHEPLNWSASGGVGGTDYGVLEPGPMGVNALWMKTSAGTLEWESAVIALGGAYAGGDILCLTFGYRGDGQIRVTVDYNVGGDETIDLTAGSDFSYNQIVIPDVGGGVAPANLTIKATMQLNGDYFEFMAPGLYQIGAVFGGDVSYVAMPVLSAGATNGFVTDYSLRYNTFFGADLYGGNDNVVCASGIMQPGWPGGAGDTKGPQSVVAQFIHLLTGNTISIRFHDPGGTGLFLGIYDGAAVQAQNASMTHALGDQWAWILYAGLNDSGNYRIGAKICKVGTSTVYTAEDNTGVTPNFYFDRLRVGGTGSDSEQFEGIIGGVQGYTGRYTKMDTDLIAMASQDVLDVYRRTNGRLYRISNLGLSPHRLDRQHWSGTISLEEVKAI